MAKKYSLILTNNFENIKLEENILLIKHQNYLKKNFKAEVVNFPEVSRSELYKSYDKCEKIFNSLMHELTVALNFAHGSNYSFRAWDIILGRWLREFIQNCEKYFQIINYTLKNYNIEKIYSLDHSSYDFVVDDTLSGTLALRNSEWFFCFSSSLLNYLQPKFKIVKTSPKQRSFTISTDYQSVQSDRVGGIRNSYSRFIYKFLRSTLSFFKSDKDAFIDSSYLPLFTEKMLELKFFQIPQLWFENKIDYKSENQKVRSKIKPMTHSNEEDLERFVRINLVKFIPRFVLENFADIKKLAENRKFPKKPRFIFTSSSHHFDEVFKFYAANKIEQKTPLYIGQHGNNEFSKIHHSYLSEWNYSDKYISWGAKRESKVMSAFNFKTFIKIKKSFDNNGKLIILFDGIFNLPSDLYKNDFNEFEKIETTIKVIDSLSSDIKKETVLRFRREYFTEQFGTKYVDFFKGLGVEIERGEPYINKLFYQTKLSLFNYDSTGVLENYIYNRPTLFMVNKDFLNCLTNEIEHKYQMLLDNNLMFIDEKKLINHINNHWSNISKWWMSEKNQEIIKEFNKDFNVKPDKYSMKKLKKLLSKTF